MSADGSQLSTSQYDGLPPAAARLCSSIDRLNRAVGWTIGLSVIAVTAMVIYEVVVRSLLGRATMWSNESVIYLSAMTYLLAGGYALYHHAHVRIDILYSVLSPRVQAWLDAVTFIAFLLYMGTLIYVGGSMAWTSMLQHETTGSPWDPPIWPVKFTIMFSGILILLQGISNLIKKFVEAHGVGPGDTQGGAI
jgi:TRAP-type mannitol/chloroaromatic compound transport system permease small subunit